jgi:hypothetical protein
VVTKDRILTWKQIAYQTLLSHEELYHLHPEFEVDEITNVIEGMIFRIKCHVLTDTLKERSISSTKTVKYTKHLTWWDMFKDHHKDSWWFRRFVRKYPPKFELISEDVTVTVNVKPMIFFPNAKIYPSGLGVLVRSYEIGEIC